MQLLKKLDTLKKGRKSIKNFLMFSLKYTVTIILKRDFVFNFENLIVSSQGFCSKIQ